MQERTAGALWAMAGENIEERLIMAERMSVRLMVDFVNSSSPLLNLVGAEGLFALASGPLGQHDNIAFAGGVPALIYLIRKPPHDHIPIIAGRPVCYRYRRPTSCVLGGFPFVWKITKKRRRILMDSDSCRSCAWLKVNLIMISLDLVAIFRILLWIVNHPAVFTITR